MYKSKFRLDDDWDPDNILEGYTDGLDYDDGAYCWFTRAQVADVLDSIPCEYRFCEPKTVLNRRDFPIILIYYWDREEIVESMPFLTNDGEISEGYFLEGYRFSEVVNKEFTTQPA